MHYQVLGLILGALARAGAHRLEIILTSDGAQISHQPRSRPAIRATVWIATGRLDPDGRRPENHAEALAAEMLPGLGLDQPPFSLGAATLAGWTMAAAG